MFHTVEQIRNIEHTAVASGMDLMERAGVAAADFISARFGSARPILCLVGPGNNGGDALVCARHLRQRGYQVDAVHLPPAGGVPVAAMRAHQSWTEAGGTLLNAIPKQSYLLIVDGVFGIGLSKPLMADWQVLIDQANALARPVLSLDVPSGIHADNGAALGRPMLARWTLTFLGQVRGLATGAALDYVGERHQANLGVTPPDAAVTSTRAAVQRAWKPRRHDTHKGSFGTVAVIGGAEGMVGAAMLAGRAALAIGAGKAHVACLAASVPSYDAARPELMVRRVSGWHADAAEVLVVGPGLGQSEAAIACLEDALRGTHALVLDADALNLISGHADLATLLRLRSAATILTPHPSEAARLLATTTTSVQADRYAAIRDLATASGATVVLKGAGSLVGQGSRCAVNQSGSAALANAGQGDALSGTIGGLMAQGLGAWEAACAGCYLHGAASDLLCARDGRKVTLAADLIDVYGELSRWLTKTF